MKLVGPIEALERRVGLNPALLSGWSELERLYRDLVEDPETNIVRLLRFCGSEPDPGCLRFHRTDRSINSASSEQVRQPLNRRGLTDWQHFAPWLAALQEAVA